VQGPPPLRGGLFLSAVTGRVWRRMPTSVLGDRPLSAARNSNLESAANGGTTSRALQGRPAPSMGGRRCCNRAPPTQSQLLRGWKCAYTRAHKDSATMTVQRHFRWKMTALSPGSAGIRISLRCSGAWEANVEGVPNDFQVAGRHSDGAACRCLFATSEVLGGISNEPKDTTECVP
jgi:hypothetical protein